MRRNNNNNNNNATALIGATVLTHENGSLCDGGENCKNLPHGYGRPGERVIVGFDARAGFGEPNREIPISEDIKFSAQMLDLERTLHTLSLSLTTAAQLAEGKPVNWTLRMCTVLVHTAHRLLEVSLKTRSKPSGLCLVMSGACVKIDQLIKEAGQ